MHAWISDHPLYDHTQLSSGEWVTDAELNRRVGIVVWGLTIFLVGLAVMIAANYGLT